MLYEFFHAPRGYTVRGGHNGRVSATHYVAHSIDLTPELRDAIARELTMPTVLIDEGDYLAVSTYGDQCFVHCDDCDIGLDVGDSADRSDLRSLAEQLAPWLPWHPDYVSAITCITGWGVRRNNGPWKVYDTEQEALASLED